MEIDPPPWYIPRSRAPEKYDFFISKVGEDDAEVIELKSEITALSGRGGRPGLRCFLDRHDWSKGVPSFQVIKDELIASRHMLVWATRNYLESSRRGWVWVELAYANLIDECRQHDALVESRRRFAPFVAPIFRSVTIDEVQRTPLLNYWERSLLAHARSYSISEIARELVSFSDENRRRSRRRR